MDYMGTTDNAKRAWMLNFVDKLAGQPAVYFVGSSDVAAISAAVNSFVDALEIVEQPNGRNPGTTAAKNDARDAAAGICRQYVRGVKYNAGISDQAKIDAGIKPPGTLPEPRPCPTSAPLLSI